jgi:O-6-methylguanine DNA methyltransferase
MFLISRKVHYVPSAFLFILCYHFVMKSFTEKVYDVVRRIPEGKTLTYKQVAEKVGSPKSFRAVGNVLNKNYNFEIPCHRVIRTDGKLGGYNRGIKAKKIILKNEGYIK